MTEGVYNLTLIGIHSFCSWIRKLSTHFNLDNGLTLEGNNWTCSVRHNNSTLNLYGS